MGGLICEVSCGWGEDEQKGSPPGSQAGNFCRLGAFCRIQACCPLQHVQASWARRGSLPQNAFGCNASCSASIGFPVKKKKKKKKKKRIQKKESKKRIKKKRSTKRIKKE